MNSPIPSEFNSSSTNRRSPSATSPVTRARAGHSRPRTQAWLDAALVTGYLLGASFFTLLSLTPPFETPLPGMLLVIFASLTVLLLRHTWPIPALGAAVSITLVSSLIGTGWEASLLLIFVTETALKQSGRRVWWVSTASLVTLLLAAVLLGWRQHFGFPLYGRAPTPEADIPAATFNFALIFIVPTVIALLAARNRAHRTHRTALLVAQAEHARREQQQRTNLARAAEREQISREMHDVIAHSLAVMIALSDGAESVIRDDPAQAQLAVQRIGETGRRTLGEVRRLLESTPDDTEPTHPLAGVLDLPDLIEEFRTAGLPVTLTIQPRSRPHTAAPLDPFTSLDEGLSFAVFRIVQESLTNSLRHAKQPREVSVTVTEHAADHETFQGATLHVQVTDYAAEVHAHDSTGRGLVGIRERAALYAGTVETGPHQAGGWRVTVTLPLKES